uniref:Protein-tyrosine sulfotransferase n=1 Tax=Romanomermis culicivorax TaxID=13658 RepID=A0A915IV19_ROMCU
MRRNFFKSHNLICIICILISCLSLYFYWSQCFRYEYFEQGGDYGAYDLTKQDWRKSILVTGAGSQKYDYGPYSHLIFIGGFPRSGTTLMRVMLDAHPDVRNL